MASIKYGRKTIEDVITVRVKDNLDCKVNLIIEYEKSDGETGQFSTRKGYGLKIQQSGGSINTIEAIQPVIIKGNVKDAVCDMHLNVDGTIQKYLHFNMYEGGFYSIKSDVGCIIQSYKDSQDALYNADSKVLHIDGGLYRLDTTGAVNFRNMQTEVECYVYNVRVHDLLCIVGNVEKARSCYCFTKWYETAKNMV